MSDARYNFEPDFPFDENLIQAFYNEDDRCKTFERDYRLELAVFEQNHIIRQ